MYLTDIFIFHHLVLFVPWGHTGHPHELPSFLLVLSRSFSLAQTHVDPHQVFLDVFTPHDSQSATFLCALWVHLLGKTRTLISLVNVYNFETILNIMLDCLIPSIFHLSLFVWFKQYVELPSCFDVTA